MKITTESQAKDNEHTWLVYLNGVLQSAAAEADTKEDYVIIDGGIMGSRRKEGQVVLVRLPNREIGARATGVWPKYLVNLS